MPEELKVTTAQAAALMGKSNQFIRIAIQRELVPFGMCLKMPGSSVHTYYISPKELCDYLGLTMEQLRERLSA